jgi:carboxypeptidase family protein
VHLDGGVESALVRLHLDDCEQCRHESVRMASTDDLLAALLTHEPDDRFFAALEAFLEERLHSGDASESIPPALEGVIAAESARLEAHRWARVTQAMPSHLAVAARPEPEVKPVAAEARPAAPEPQPVAPPRAADSKSRPAMHPVTLHVTPLPAPKPAPARPAASVATGKPARRDRASRFIGVAVALVLMVAGLVLRPRGSRPRAHDADVPSVVDRVVNAEEAPAPRIVESHAPPPQRASSDDAPPSLPEVVPTPAKVSPAETHAAVSPAHSAPTHAKAPATPSPPATQRSRASATPSQTAAAAPERGLLCGRVRDESGMPIVGAQVLLADVRVGALTDRSGRFCISVPIGSRTLSVIALGFTTERRVVKVARSTAEFAVTLRSAAVQQSP